jgi:hypothetical protein
MKKKTPVRKRGLRANEAAWLRQKMKTNPNFTVGIAVTGPDDLDHLIDLLSNYRISKIECHDHGVNIGIRR